jgi:hypothetical protein
VRIDLIDIFRQSRLAALARLAETRSLDAPPEAAATAVDLPTTAELEMLNR